MVLSGSLAKPGRPVSMALWKDPQLMRQALNPTTWSRRVAACAEEKERQGKSAAKRGSRTYGSDRERRGEEETNRNKVKALQTSTECGNMR